MEAAASDRFERGRFALQAGRLDEAQDHARDLLRTDPESPAALWLAARVALATREAAAAIALLERVLANPALPPEQRAESLLTLGLALGDSGRTAEAFTRAAEGNAILRALHVARAAGRESELARLRRLRRWFETVPPGVWTPAPRLAGPLANEAAGHVFLVGFPRSGTTLLEQALAGHPRLTALEERPLLAAPYQALLSCDAACGRLAGLGAREADAWRAHYWAAAAAEGAMTDGRVFLDKSPAGTLDLAMVARLFPRAKVLFAIRDPRDVVLSCFRNAFRMNALTYAFTSLEETAAVYTACMSLAAVYRERLPLDVLDVRYERLVDDLRGELDRVARFIGLEAAPGMLDIAATAARRTIRTPSAAHVRAGLNREGLDRWKPFAQALAPVDAVLAPWIERFGYHAG